jgi:hypothetical protein
MVNELIMPDSHQFFIEVHLKQKGTLVSIDDMVATGDLVPLVVGVTTQGLSELCPNKD